MTRVIEYIEESIPRYMACAAGGKIATSLDGASWIDKASIGGVGISLRGLAYVNDTYVVVGDGGSSSSHYIAVSTDEGDTWTPGTSVITTTYLRGVVYADTLAVPLFVCIGESGGIDDGKIQTSPDGITWTQRSISGCGPITGIAFGNNMIVVVSSTGKASRSADGINWTVPAAITSHLQTVTYANGMFMALGDAGKCAVSVNGIAWTVRTPASIGSNTFMSVAGGDGVWVAGTTTGGAGEGIYRSINDGVSWTKTYTGGSNPSAVYGGGLFVLGNTANGQGRTSPDGITWTTRTLHSAAVSTYGLIYVP